MTRGRVPIRTLSATLGLGVCAVVVCAAALIGARADVKPPEILPQPGTPQYNGDWAVGCDNILRCEAISLQPENASANEGVLLQIVREGGPAGRVTVRARGLDPLPEKLSLVVDGRYIAELKAENAADAAVEGTAALQAVRALAFASTIELRARKRRALVATPSPAGLQQSLAFMDARQGRNGTVSALASKGAQPDTAVPAVPDAPAIAQRLSPDANSAPKLNDAELAAAIKLAVCDASLMAQGVAELFPLDSDAALLLLPCEAGAYNVSAVPLIARGAPGARTLSVARFDFAPGFTGEPGKPPLVVNALWDSPRGILSSLAKGRGAGDCGAAEDYVWDGAMFRLVESRAMQVCRGAWDWIRLWTAMPRREVSKG